MAAAILREGRVLACRRTAPAAAAGRWELPGGKVEPGESPEDALVREIGEELGCVVEVVAWLEGEAPIGESHVLRAAITRIVAGEPHPREHDRTRWLAPEELGDVDWLEPDRPFLEAVQTACGDVGAAPAARAVFFERDDATEVARRLEAGGWAARVHRERFQGEDDEEDQPWAVVTDAPLLVLELLVDEHDGWLEGLPTPPAVPPAPVPLPTQPRRLKRPQ